MAKMNLNMNSLPMQSSDYLFVVWGEEYQGPRSRVMASKLGIDAHFIAAKLPRGAIYIPIKYPILAVRTLFLLFRNRPKVVFVQNPPILAVFCIFIYCLLCNAGFIIDAHSEAFLARGWTAPPKWLKKFLAKKAITTIVTNDYLEHLVQGWGGNALIIRDVPSKFEISSHFSVSDQFNIALINTFAEDEPLSEALNAAKAIPEVQFYVTGKISVKDTSLVTNAPKNVCFTNYLQRENYYALLNSVDAVMCLTKRNHTMQRGACEALSLGKPIITTNWEVLRQYFHKGTVHVENSTEGILQGILHMVAQFKSLSTGIIELQIEQQQEWQLKVDELSSLINSRLKDQNV
jgi:glycosyltransferase involved in cell wall biosynthesis